MELPAFTPASFRKSCAGNTSFIENGVFTQTLRGRGEGFQISIQNLASPKQYFDIRISDNVDVLTQNSEYMVQFSSEKTSSIQQPTSAQQNGCHGCPCPFWEPCFSQQCISPHIPSALTLCWLSPWQGTGMLSYLLMGIRQSIASSWL